MLYKNILLIDDDIEDTEIFIDVVNAVNKDIICHTTMDPTKVFKDLKSAEILPDLIFMDINMPCLNGLDLLQQLRDDPKLQHLEVILISSPSEEVIRRLSPKKNIEKYIEKSSNYKDFVSQLQKILL